MPLEIKILDYGDIELESSFLVLGRDCGRTRRVLTLGFLIVGGPYPVVVDTGYRSNQIMETLGMRGLQFHDGACNNDACARPYNELADVLREDLARGLDCLTSLPYVAPGRIGTFGLHTGTDSPRLVTPCSRRNPRFAADGTEA